MQGKRLLAAVSGITLLAIATPALAIMSAPFGWYLEGNAGSTSLTKKSYPGSSSTSGIGGNANVGYKFMPYFAAEIGYSLYANTSVTDNSTNTKAGSDRHYSYDFAFKGIVPVTNSGLEFFAKLGIDQVRSSSSVDNATAASNIGWASSSHSATGLYWGGGAQYYFIPEMAANVQWQQATGSSSTGNVALISAGLSFIFD